MGKHFDNLVRFANIVERRLGILKLAGSGWEPEWLVTYKSWNPSDIYKGQDGNIAFTDRDLRDKYKDCVELWQKIHGLVTNSPYFSQNAPGKIGVAIKNFIDANDRGRGGRGWHQGDLETFNALMDALGEFYKNNAKVPVEVDVGQIKNEFNSCWRACFPKYSAPEKSTQSVTNEPNKPLQPGQPTQQAPQATKQESQTPMVIPEDRVTSKRPSKYQRIDPSIQTDISWVLFKLQEDDELQVPDDLRLPLQADGVLGPQTRRAINLYADAKDVSPADFNDANKLKESLRKDIDEYAKNQPTTSVDTSAGGNPLLRRMVQEDAANKQLQNGVTPSVDSSLNGYQRPNNKNNQA
jgi:hypothetical protein